MAMAKVGVLAAADKKKAGVEMMLVSSGELHKQKKEGIREMVRLGAEKTADL